MNTFPRSHFFHLSICACLAVIALASTAEAVDEKIAFTSDRAGNL